MCPSLGKDIQAVILADMTQISQKCLPPSGKNGFDCLSVAKCCLFILISENAEFFLVL